MWDAVQHVSTGLALVAFLGAVAVVAYRANLKHRLKIINTVPRQRRAQVITKELNAFGIAATNLTTAQQFDLAKREIDLRARRLCIFGGITVVTILAERDDITGRSAAPSATTDKPTDDDVERAIRACSAGTKAAAELEGGLNLLKKRIVTGEGKFSKSDIPSVIGSGVQTDAAKIGLFEKIQQCVVKQIYPHSENDKSFTTGTLLPGHDSSPPSRCPLSPSSLAVYFGNAAGEATADIFPVTIIEMHQAKILTLNRNTNNEISVNLYVYGADGRYIVKLIDNKFALNPHNEWTKEETSDRTSLIVYDRGSLCLCVR